MLVCKQCWNWFNYRRAFCWLKENIQKKQKFNLIFGNKQKKKLGFIKITELTTFIIFLRKDPQSKIF